MSAEEYRSVNELVTYPQMVSGVLIDVSNIYKRADPWVCSGRDMHQSAHGRARW